MSTLKLHPNGKPHMPNRMIYGPPGVGKTATIHADYNRVILRLASTMLTEDIGGIPRVDREDPKQLARIGAKGYADDRALVIKRADDIPFDMIGRMETRTVPPLFVQTWAAYLRGGTCALLLDEIDKGDQRVVDTLLTLVLERHNGEGCVLPPTLDIWATANPPEFSGGDGISQAMLDRFQRAEFVPDFQRWGAWLIDKWAGPDKVKRSVAVAVIDAVSGGDLALMEQAGEGMAWRYTSPRSVVHTLDTCLCAPSMREAEKFSSCTPNAHSCILQIFDALGYWDRPVAEPVQAKARTTARASKGLGPATFNI